MVMEGLLSTVRVRLCESVSMRKVLVRAVSSRYAAEWSTYTDAILFRVRDLETFAISKKSFMN